MNQENPDLNFPGRWYDRDPVLKRAIEQLRQATDKQQAQVALNIIKIVVEHQIESETDIQLEALDTDLPYRGAWDQHQQHRRWYDLHETLRSAMRLLSDTPDDLQSQLIPSIAQMIVNVLEQQPSRE